MHGACVRQYCRLEPRPQEHRSESILGQVRELYNWAPLGLRSERWSWKALCSEFTAGSTVRLMPADPDGLRTNVHREQSEFALENLSFV
ncbi:hypothetical protein NDU88_006430 [Pleurodeles waltl]|uniref:Uncharacterized protein n=1 Tax=Pleurodeles waltl TaxID=8319 RepID=A0AAV7NZB1_PLEWA|nr:hypothetical protein NDU88_006430 [Pleurodeles waltl]